MREATTASAADVVAYHCAQHGRSIARAIAEPYLREGQLHVEQLGRGYAWFDAGTSDSLIEASVFVQSLEKRQGLKIGCLEEIAFDQGWISAVQLADAANRYGKSTYGGYLHGILEETD